MRPHFYQLIIILILFSSGICPVRSQQQAEIYFVQFHNKPQDNYTLDNPREYLSEKAIQRRLKSNIPYTEHDLPVYQNYKNLVVSEGAQIIFTTKWMNGVGIIPDNAEALEGIHQLNFVKNIAHIQSVFSESVVSGIDHLKMNEQIEKVEIIQDKVPGELILTKQTNILDYGFSEHQIRMLFGDALHDEGFLGEGMTIAVLDNGFFNVNEISVFDSLWIKNQVLGTYDFAKNGPIEFNEGSHGTKVLSVLAANKPGILMGTAPNANYYLIRTEIANSESILEEYLWMCGAEFADSVGADIINSSVGYTVFDDESKNHTYADLDGNTTIVARAADLAASKGILVITSAGNYGNKDWIHIGSPSDADSVLAVGAVDENGNLASFSSIGPTSDGRIKPNIVAQGLKTAFIDIDGSPVQGNGTSFSAPLISGLAACLWQTNPQLNNMQILNSIQKSGTYAALPNEHYGYGMPDFSLTKQFTNEFIVPSTAANLLINAYPNPFHKNLRLILKLEENSTLYLNIIDLTGKILQAQEINLNQGLNFVNLNSLDFLPTGVYILQLKNSEHDVFKKVIKIF